MMYWKINFSFSWQFRKLICFASWCRSGRLCRRIETIKDFFYFYFKTENLYNFHEIPKFDPNILLTNHCADWDVGIKTDGTHFQEKIISFFCFIERNVELVPAIRFICLRNEWRGRALLCTSSITCDRPTGTVKYGGFLSSGNLNTEYCAISQVRCDINS